MNIFAHKKYPFPTLLIICTLQSATADNLNNAYTNCVLQKTELADKTLLAEDIKTACKKLSKETEPSTDTEEDSSLIYHRIEIEQNNQFKPFTLMAFKPNFILAATYNHQGYDSSLYQPLAGEEPVSFDKSEAQFQISIKTPLIVNLFKKDISLYAGYTNRSFWQVYNGELSRPFRETNHEPEIWLQNTRNTEIFGFNNRISMLGLSHQSNGRGNQLSRSWNRIYANFAFEKESFVFAFKIWKRFNEDFATDDNPDITDYMGHGEFRAVFSRNNHTLSLMSRNNIESGFDKGATELGWSFPIGDRKDLKGYIQIFSGYGESLIDYNQKVSRIGFGISLSDWL